MKNGPRNAACRQQQHGSKGHGPQACAKHASGCTSGAAAAQDIHPQASSPNPPAPRAAAAGSLAGPSSRCPRTRAPRRRCARAAAAAAAPSGRRRACRAGGDMVWASSLSKGIKNSHEACASSRSNTAGAARAAARRPPPPVSWAIPAHLAVKAWPWLLLRLHTGPAGGEARRCCCPARCTGACTASAVAMAAACCVALLPGPACDAGRRWR